MKTHPIGVIINGKVVKWAKLGKAHKERLLLESHFLDMWRDPPEPFNEGFRPGLRLEVSEAHGKWCEENPGVSREVRAAAFAATYDRLTAKHPTYRELKARGVDVSRLKFSGAGGWVLKC